MPPGRRRAAGPGRAGDGGGGPAPRPGRAHTHGGGGRGDRVRGHPPGPGPGQRVRHWRDDLGAAARRSGQRRPQPRRRPRRGLHLARLCRARSGAKARAPGPRRAARRRAPAAGVRNGAGPGPGPGGAPSRSDESPARERPDQNGTVVGSRWGPWTIRFERSHQDHYEKKKNMGFSITDFQAKALDEWTSGRVDEWLELDSCAKDVGSILDQGTYKNQPKDA
ncbi:C2 calcium-dependent domain-containing protein 4B-like [Pipistrellus kuhlii]|uniref:C2 calcium-dependent domain-containing protein 4B-like n=1 Tax=Pipistrellus kuhlii TaxID=59472 RepID=UPI001E273B9B|nr:C2 calcium-dependent domain-containing protein 4B-like [Pipistrellus kuhlii]